MYSSATKFSSDSIAHGQCGPPAIPSDLIASISSSWPAAGNSVNSSWPATESLWPASQHLQCTFHLFYKTGMTSKPSAFPASANKVCVNNHSSAIQSLRPASHRLQYIVCIILSLFLWPAIHRSDQKATLAAGKGRWLYNKRLWNSIDFDAGRGATLQSESVDFHGNECNSHIWQLTN